MRAARGQRAVIIDEGSARWTPNGIDAMAEHLHDLSDRLDRVILVTHQAAMRKYFSDGWIVQRRDGTSRIESRPTAGSRGARLEAIEPGDRAA